MGHGLVGQAAAVGDQFAEAGAAEAVGLGEVPGRLGVGKGGQEFEPAAATLGVESLRYQSHEAETAYAVEIRQG